jgi:hypothetical protein
LTLKAEKRHRADFGECLLLVVEPPFLLGACPSLEALHSLFHIYRSDRLPGASCRSFGPVLKALAQGLLIEYRNGNPAESDTAYYVVDCSRAAAREVRAQQIFK